MKKALKITGISLLSLVALVIIVASIAVWIVFTPSKLTPIVRGQIENYISCPTTMGDVELTFFSTFPEFGLKINGLTLINKMDGVPSDTLMHAGDVTATIDIVAFLKQNKVLINEVLLSSLDATLFTRADGKTNFDVFITDTTTVDTAAFKNPFDLIALNRFELQNARIKYIDQQSKLSANAAGMNADFSFSMKQQTIDALLHLKATSLSVSMDTVAYLNNAAVTTSMPFIFDLDRMKFSMKKSTELTVNGLRAKVDGFVEIPANSSDIPMDINFSTDDYRLTELFKLIPKPYLVYLNGMQLDGVLATKGSVKGVFNEKSMPLIQLNAGIAGGSFRYEAFPYHLKDMAGNADVYLDMNKAADSKITINDFSARTGQSDLAGKGSIHYILMDDMLFDLAMKVKLNLPELNPMIPADLKMSLNGVATGEATTKFYLSDAMNAKLEKMNINAKFRADGLGIQYDTIYVKSDKSTLDLRIPNKGKVGTGFLYADLWSNLMNVNQGNAVKTSFRNLKLLTETSNLMESDKPNTMLFGFRFDHLMAGMDNMTVNLDKSTGKAGVKMNLNDAVVLPWVNCDFDVSALDFSMDSTTAHIDYPKGELTMTANNNQPDVTKFNIDYKASAMRAAMGQNSFTAGFSDILTNIVYNAAEKTTALQWTPKGSLNVRNCHISTPALKAAIQMPELSLDFTPDEYIIKQGKMLVDNSDFELTGKLWNVDNYLRDKGLLKGEFSFNSTLTDVYRIMELTSGFGETDTTTTIIEDKTASAPTQTTAESTTSSGPYMVPKGMDITLHANVKKAMLGFDSAQNVLGDLYLRDGLLVLQDLRFISSAAKMQLTAMYRTPRKNHIFVGMDYHMVDIEIKELLSMFPAIDSMMPMLRSFGGRGEFHMAVETYTDSLYKPKKSTIRGVTSLRGEDLVLMDGETFSEIAKKLMFNKKTKNKVDSLSAEATIFRNEVDIYPFQIVLDKYKAVIAGRHNLDMSVDYHISLTDSPLPVQLGVDIKGTMDDVMNHPMKCISLVKPKYAKLYRPAQRREIDTRQLEIRKMIRDALTSKVIKQ